MRKESAQDKIRKTIEGILGYLDLRYAEIGKTEIQRLEYWESKARKIGFTLEEYQPRINEIKEKYSKQNGN